MQLYVWWFIVSSRTFFLTSDTEALINIYDLKLILGDLEFSADSEKYFGFKIDTLTAKLHQFLFDGAFFEGIMNSSHKFARWLKSHWLWTRVGWRDFFKSIFVNSARFWPARHKNYHHNFARLLLITSQWG